MEWDVVGSTRGIHDGHCRYKYMIFGIDQNDSNEIEHMRWPHPQIFSSMKLFLATQVVPIFREAIFPESSDQKYDDIINLIIYLINGIMDCIN